MAKLTLVNTSRLENEHFIVIDDGNVYRIRPGKMKVIDMDNFSKSLCITSEKSGRDRLFRNETNDVTIPKVEVSTP